MIKNLTANHLYYYYEDNPQMITTQNVRKQSNRFLLTKTMKKTTFFCFLLIVWRVSNKLYVACILLSFAALYTYPQLFFLSPFHLNLLCLDVFLTYFKNIFQDSKIPKLTLYSLLSQFVCKFKSSYSGYYAGLYKIVP